MDEAEQTQDQTEVTQSSPLRRRVSNSWINAAVLAPTQTFEAPKAKAIVEKKLKKKEPEVKKARTPNSTQPSEAHKKAEVIEKKKSEEKEKEKEEEPEEKQQKKEDKKEEKKEVKKKKPEHEDDVELGVDPDHKGSKKKEAKNASKLKSVCAPPVGIQVQVPSDYYQKLKQWCFEYDTLLDSERGVATFGIREETRSCDHFIVQNNQTMHVIFNVFLPPTSYFGCWPRIGIIEPGAKATIHFSFNGRVAPAYPHDGAFSYNIRDATWISDDDCKKKSRHLRQYWDQFAGELDNRSAHKRTYVLRLPICFVSGETRHGCKNHAHRRQKNCDTANPAPGKEEAPGDAQAQEKSQKTDELPSAQE
ncbi:unnamed protein product, partial [Mesorhabditis spiculigera]